MARQGMEIAPFSLSANQAHEYGVDHVYASIDNGGNGIALNVADNQTLAGVILQARGRSYRGRRFSYVQILPPELVLTQAGLIDDSIQAEIDWLHGSTDGEGRKVPGVLEQLDARDRDLAEWRHRLPGERQRVSEFVDELATSLASSTNTLRDRVGERAETMHGLKAKNGVVNPPAMRSKIPGIKEDLLVRSTEVARTSRKNRDNGWLYREWHRLEAGYLGQTRDIGLRMLSENDDDTARLERMARSIKLNPQLLNAVASQTDPRSRKVESNTVLEGLVLGIDLVSQKEYLSLPFRHLGGLTLPRIESLDTDATHRISDSLRARMAMLESLPAIEPYAHWRGRILMRGDMILRALETSLKASEIKQLSNEAASLTARFVLPGDNPSNTEPWYGHRLVGIKQS